MLSVLRGYYPYRRRRRRLSWYSSFDPTSGSYPRKSRFKFINFTRRSTVSGRDRLDDDDDERIKITGRGASSMPAELNVKLQLTMKWPRAVSFLIAQST